MPTQSLTRPLTRDLTRGMTERFFSDSFSPADISGLVLWLDASDASTITETAGAVSQWDDKSGEDNHATQTTEALKPTTNSNTLNGRNVLTFSADRLDVPKPSGTTDIFIVFHTTDSTYLHMSDGGGKFSLAADDGSSDTTLSSLGTPTFKLNGILQSFTDRNDVHDAMNNNNACLLMKGVDISAWTSTLNLCNFGAPFSFDGDIAEIAFYNNSISTENETRFFNYAAEKWAAV